MAAELAADLDARAGVERRERLVEQEQSGVAHERACKRNSLCLATRELEWLCVGAIGEVDAFQPTVGAVSSVALGDAAAAQGKRDVLSYRQKGEQQVVLEHHADPTPFGWYEHVGVGVVPSVAVHGHVSLVDGLESREDAEQRGLPGTVRSEDRDDLLADREVDCEVERAEPASDAALEDHGEITGARRTSGRAD